MKLLLILVLLYMILFLDLTLNIVYDKRVKYTVKYNGLVWVALDYMNILATYSTDKPMPIFRVTKTVLVNQKK